MGAAVAAAVEQHGVIQQRGVAFGGVLQAADKVRKLLRQKAVPFPQCLRATLLVPAVRELVHGRAVAEQGGEFSGDGGGAVHVPQLIGREPGRVGLKGQEDQIVHRADQFQRRLVRGVQVKSGGIDVGLGDIQPLLGTFNALLDLPDRRKIFVQLLPVVATETQPQGPGVVEHPIQHARGVSQLPTLGGLARLVDPEETIEDLPGFAERGQWLPGTTE